MKQHPMCRACAQQIVRRCYITHEQPRDYSATVAALNSLQSNSSIVEDIKNKGHGWNRFAIPQMIGWVRRIGYEPSDLDQLNPIHIAGTKGKGSTSTFISSILAEYIPTKHSIHAERLPSGVGLYTSPHLRFVRERIQINNQPISEDLFVKYFWEVWDRLETTRSESNDSEPRSIDGKPVYFHFLTLMAFHCFLQEKVGTAIIECGIGGEYDTTNILVKPCVTGITSLGIDHEGMLGNTLESIAWHKAGIFKEDVPAYSVPQPENAEKVLRERANERKASLHFVPTHPALEGDSIKLGLQGAFQKTNASLAVAVSAQHLQRLGYNSIPDPLDPNHALPDEFVTGLEAARLGGRCEIRPDHQLDGLTWYIDGAHTLTSIEVAAQWFAATISRSSDINTMRILILNQQTRDASSLARRLYETLASALDDARPFKHAIFCVNKTTKSRGYKPDLVSINIDKRAVDDLTVQKKLAETWDEIDPHASVHVMESIEEAVAKAREISAGKPVEVLVTGSLHLVGGLIEVLESEMERRAMQTT